MYNLTKSNLHNVNELADSDVDSSLRAFLGPLVLSYLLQILLHIYHHSRLDGNKLKSIKKYMYIVKKNNKGNSCNFTGTNLPSVNESGIFATSLDIIQGPFLTCNMASQTYNQKILINCLFDLTTFMHLKLTSQRERRLGNSTRAIHKASQISSK